MTVSRRADQQDICSGSCDAADERALPKQVAWLQSATLARWPWTVAVTLAGLLAYALWRAAWIDTITALVAVPNCAGGGQACLAGRGVRLWSLMVVTMRGTEVIATDYHRFQIARGF